MAVGFISLWSYSDWLATKPIPKKACTTASRECELAKDWLAVKIINLPGANGADAFGDALVVGNWYLLAAKNNILFPVSRRYVASDPTVALSGINIGPAEMEEAQSNQGFFDGTAIKLDSAQLNISYDQSNIKIDVLVLCLGNGELIPAAEPLEVFFHSYQKE